MTPSLADVPARNLLAPLARPDGTFAMVALDQRESLRTMMAEDRGLDVGAVADEELRAFKLAAVRALSGLASAVLIDRHYGFDDISRDRMLPGSCGLILAADALTQERGRPVQDTALDGAVDPAAARAGGAHALKLLVIWRRDAERARRLEMSRAFVELCAASGLASVLEGVVRATPQEIAGETWSHADAVVEASAELAATRPSLYKVEVPEHGLLDEADLIASCARIDAAVDVPWVVLSQGVDAADFPRAVESACRAGASGFLAGRGIWRDCVDAQDLDGALRDRAVGRLQTLSDIVAARARPWDRR